MDRIERLVKDDSLKELKASTLLVCEYFLEGKMTERQLLAKGERAKAPVDIIHS